MRSSLYIPIAFVISHKWHCLVPGVYYLLCFALALIINFGFSYPLAVRNMKISILLYTFFTIAFWSMQFSFIYKCNCHCMYTMIYKYTQHLIFSFTLCVFVSLTVLCFHISDFRVLYFVCGVFCFLLSNVSCHFYHSLCVCQFSSLFKFDFSFSNETNWKTKLIFILLALSPESKVNNLCTNFCHVRNEAISSLNAIATIALCFRVTVSNELNIADKIKLKWWVFRLNISATLSLVKWFFFVVR